MLNAKNPKQIMYCSWLNMANMVHQGPPMKSNHLNRGYILKHPDRLLDGPVLSGSGLPILPKNEVLLIIPPKQAGHSCQPVTEFLIWNSELKTESESGGPP